MSTAVATRTNSGALAVPSELAAMFGAVAPNIVGGEKVPTLSIKGKVWKLSIDGNETPLMTPPDADGNTFPVPVVKAIIINQIPGRSRAMFEGGYEEGTNSAPVCWSTNGENPDSDVKEPKASSCAGCENSVKGSKINDRGEATVACPTGKRICVVPSNKADFKALVLKLANTSLWEAEPKEEAQGWYAFDAYMKFLKSNGITHTAMVETMMKFDSNVAYPKVMFKYNGPISLETAQVIVPRIESEEVKHVLGLDKVGAGGQKQIEAPKAASKPAVAQEPKKSEPAKVAEQPKQEVKAEVKPEPVKETPKAEPAKAVVVDSDDALASVLSSWE
jgi:hypothetical protein